MHAFFSPVGHAVRLTARPVGWWLGEKVRARLHTGLTFITIESWFVHCRIPIYCIYIFYLKDYNKELPS